MPGMVEPGVMPVPRVVFHLPTVSRSHPQAKYSVVGRWWCRKPEVPPGEFPAIFPLFLPIQTTTLVFPSSRCTTRSKSESAWRGHGITPFEPEGFAVTLLAAPVASWSRDSRLQKARSSARGSDEQTVQSMSRFCAVNSAPTSVRVESCNHWLGQDVTYHPGGR